jgi:hypothetical protein
MFYPSGRSLFLLLLLLSDGELASACGGGGCEGCSDGVDATEVDDALAREPGARVFVPLRIGTLTLVDIFKISLPCTVS